MEIEKEKISLRQKIWNCFICLILGLTIVLIAGGIKKYIDSQPKYITKINIIYNDGTKETLYYNGEQDVYLDKGDLRLGQGYSIRSFVRSYSKSFIESKK